MPVPVIIDGYNLLYAQGEAPATGTDSRLTAPAPATEEQQQEKADDAAQSLQDAFKAAPGAGGAPPPK